MGFAPPLYDKLIAPPQEPVVGVTESAGVPDQLFGKTLTRTVSVGVPEVPLTPVQVRVNVVSAVRLPELCVLPLE